MKPQDAAIASAEAVGGLGSGFMLDMGTYARGGELGFEGMDFYVAGRGGALGDVHGDVVAASFVFFEPEGVRRAWDASRAVLPPRQAATAFIGCGHAWAEDHLGVGVDYRRLAELAGRLAAAANPAGAPLFAAWRAMPEPESASPEALALHRMNVLRELRGGWHAAATLAVGLAPLDAVMVKTPYMAGIFGWPEPYPEPDDAARTRWAQAEEMTNHLMAVPFAALAEAERAELVELASAALAAVT
ncbi:MAG: hypothetical protein MUF83_00405 [Acidimicrobiales bacterium]|jgi:hypothetical protein|nr:hypothetical protein [Acidimicrobiales bacterium]